VRCPHLRRHGGRISAPPGCSSSCTIKRLHLPVVLLSCFDLAGRRNKYSLRGPNFPAVMYVYEGAPCPGRARRHPGPAEDGYTVPLEIPASIDIRLCSSPLSHVIFRSGFSRTCPPSPSRPESGAYVVAGPLPVRGTVARRRGRPGTGLRHRRQREWLCGLAGRANL